MNKKSTEIAEKIVTYFDENEEIFNNCIEELDADNRYLIYDKYYNMYEFDKIFSNKKPSEILEMTASGYNENYTKSEGKRYKFKGDKFNPFNKYFRFDIYNGIVSANEKDYTEYIDIYTVEDMSENIEKIPSIAEDKKLSKLFAQLKADNSEKEQEQ